MKVLWKPQIISNLIFVKKIVCVIALVIFSLYVLHHYMAYRREMKNFEAREALILETNECLEAGDWICAERNVKKLYEETPEDTVLQLNMAVVLLEQERYSECIDFIDQLNRKNGNLDFLREKASLLQREMDSMNLERSMHFRVEYDGHPARENVLEALSVLEVAYDSLCRLFHFYPENKIAVVLHQTAEHNGIGVRPDWVGAVFDGKLRVPENLMNYTEVYRAMLFHELTHAFLRQMTRGNIPSWVNEGIAQVVDGSRSDLQKPQGRAPSLSDLNAPFVNKSHRDSAEKLYWYSQKMVKLLLDRDGSFEHFKDFVQDLRRLGDEKALQKYYSVSVEQLWEEACQ